MLLVPALQLNAAETGLPEVGSCETGVPVDWLVVHIITCTDHALHILGCCTDLLALGLADGWVVRRVSAARFY